MKFTLSDIAELEKEARQLSNNIVDSDIRKAEELGETFWKDYHAAFAAVTAMNRILSEINKTKGRTFSASLSDKY